MNRNRLVICEKTGRWATRLRPLLKDTGIQLLETRALTRAVSHVHEKRSCALALEVSEENFVSVLKTIRQVRRLTPAVIVALIRRSLRDQQWIMREMGADYVACSPVELPAVAKLVCQFAVNNPVPADDLRLTEQIRQRLPWQ